MAIALAALDASNVTTETESDFADELTESSENLFLRNLSQLIANSEQTAARENQLSITEVPSNSQPQFGYFLPISLTPKLRLKRLRLWNLIMIEVMTKYWHEKLSLKAVFLQSSVFNLSKSNLIIFIFHTQGRSWIKPFTNTTQPTTKSSTTKYK